MNNIFEYSTKELLQDAVICWCINWINYPDAVLCELGKATLDLCLGENKQDRYYNVEVKYQYKKIDILVSFKGEKQGIRKKYVLILEDKTNTSEHNGQIKRYCDLIKADGEYKEYDPFVTYIKTGIMYDIDYQTAKEVNTAIDIDRLTEMLKQFLKKTNSEILHSFVEYLEKIRVNRADIKDKIDSGYYEKCLGSAYGQFYFLDRIFSDRSKGSQIAKTENNLPIYVDHIYAGKNNDGSSWTEYCFWCGEYLEQNDGKKEYNYIFWRIDEYSNKSGKNNEQSIAMRHYDENARSKTNEFKNQRKREIYRKIRTRITKIEDRYGIFQPIQGKENFKESDLIFITASKLHSIGDVNEVRKYLKELTNQVIGFMDEIVLEGSIITKHFKSKL